MPKYTTFSTKYNNYLFSFNKKYSINFHHLMRSLINHLERKKQKNKSGTLWPICPRIL